jgi:hypothetical protein
MVWILIYASLKLCVASLPSSTVLTNMMKFPGRLTLSNVDSLGIYLDTVLRKERTFCDQIALK